MIAHVGNHPESFDEIEKLGTELGVEQMVITSYSLASQGGVVAGATCLAHRWSAQQQAPDFYATFREIRPINLP